MLSRSHALPLRSATAFASPHRMSADGLPPHVRSLIHGPVSTMAHIEALLALRAAAQGRSAEAVAAETHLPSSAAARRLLEELADAGLVALDADGLWRYAPANEEWRHAVDGLAEMYNAKPVTLVRAVYARPPAPVQSFADAFRLRGREP